MKLLGAIALAIASIAGCDSAPSPASLVPSSPSASPTAVATAPLPTPSAGLTAAPIPTASSATAAPLPSSATWEQIGAVADDIGVAGILVFEERYVGYGLDRQSLPWVWSSATGAEWEGTRLGEMIVPCPGYAEDYDSQVYSGASNGEEIVLVGLEYAVDASTCGTHRAASWASADGYRWQRGSGFGGDGPFADSKDVWALPGGWEALAWTGGDAPRTLWSSANGLTWSLSETLPISDPLDARIASASDGTRVMVITNNADGSADEVFGVRGGESRLRWSSNGSPWADVAFDFNASGPTRLWIAVVPGIRAPAAWIVIGSRSDEGPADIWRSTDLVHWEHGTFAKAVVAGLTWTRYGYIATGRDVYCGDGGECRPNPTHQYLSPDGLNWTQLPFDIEADLFVDGPAGVLAIDGNSGVWKLE